MELPLREAAELVATPRRATELLTRSMPTPILSSIAKTRGRLARPLDIEHVYAPDRDAMLAALRVVLDLPRQLPDRGLGGAR
jgi:hypothetical protein